ncbi:MAG: UDP-glucose 4-epimerase GalE [Mesorhizobium sp.]
MAVLVTGGAGYIGSHMVWELLDHGEEVIVLDRLSTGFNWAVAPEAKLVIGDVGDQALIKSILRRHPIDAIIHFAGSVVVPDSIADPLGYYENNTTKSRALIEAAVRGGVKHFIFSSTAAVYGMTGAEPVREDHRLVPETPYGVSKMMTELMLRDTARAHEFRYAALRYFNVAGADPSGRTGQSTAGATHLVKVAVETATGKRRRIEVFGTDYPTHDGTCIRDFIHVADLVAAHRLALAYLRRGGESIVANCGYGHGYSVLDLIEAVQRANGASFEVHLAPRREGDMPCVIADSTHLKRTLGWLPRHDDLDAIAASSLAWERALERKNAAYGIQSPEPDDWLTPSRRVGAVK